ncbi:30S ribosomal protein S11 [Candidatus Uhrbacteria bacterium]|nr:30S ribosomal protein S11 [Candidatus Uhrbacteria bacterium]
MEEEVAKIEDAVAAEKPGKTGKKAAPRKTKKKVLRQITQGHAYVQATYNNTLVTLTDPQGNVLAWSSAGHLGFKGPKKSTPYAASMVIRKLAEKVQGVGLRDLHVFVRGVGSGREAAVRGLNAQGFSVLTIKDITPIPHNGCRAPRPRRV